MTEVGTLPAVAAQRINKPGDYEMPAEHYHADPVVVPSLSCSILKLLLEKSPQHAYLSHPRLNPDFQAEFSDKFDLGSAAHTVMLHDLDNIAVIDPAAYPNKGGGIPAGWTNPQIRTARDQARNEGKTPILKEKMPEINTMVATGRRQLLQHEEGGSIFQKGMGKPERTLIWQEDVWADGQLLGKVWCRARPDWVPNEDQLPIFVNYKTSGTNCNPQYWGSRHCFDMGYHIEAAFYRRGIRAIYGVENAHYRFVAQETEVPYALSIIEFTDGVLGMADRMVEYGLRLWLRCTQKGWWPGYPSSVAYVDEMPVYLERQWLTFEETCQRRQELTGDIFQQLIAWQAPLEWDAKAIAGPAEGGN